MYWMRELEEKDLKEINSWRNDPELISKLGAPFRYINYEVDKCWYDVYMKNRNNTVRCAIVDNNDSILGLITLANIDYISRCAEMHIMIGKKENRGKGIGKFAIGELLYHAFNNLNLNRIELLVLSDNIAAKNLYSKFGFVKEGMKRAAKYKNGEYKDLELYSILRHEYLKRN